MAKKHRSGSRSPAVHDRSDDLRRRSISALSKASVIVLVDRVVQLVALAVTARLLLPAEIAVVTAAGAAISLLGLVTTLGIPSFLIQVAKFSPEVNAAARTLLLIAVAIGAGLLHAFAPAIANWFNNPAVADALRVLVLVLVAPVFSSSALARLSRDLRARDIALAELVANATGALFIAIPLAVADFGFWALAWGAVVQVSLRTVILCLIARQPNTFSADIGAMTDVIRRSSGFMLNVLLIRLDSSAPHWIIGRLLPTTQLGLFARAESLMNYPAGVFYSVVDRVIFPAVALVQNQIERLRDGALDAVRITAIIGITVAVALFFLGGDIIRLVLGPNWEGAVAPFRILAIAAYFKLAVRVNWIILRGVGQTYRLAAAQVVLLGMTIAACVIGTRWGLQGVASAVTLTICASYVVSGVLAMRAARISVPAWLAAHGHGLICGVLAALVIGPLAGYLDSRGLPSFVVLAAAALASAFVGGLAVWLAPRVFLGQAGSAALREGLALLRPRSQRPSA